VLIVGDGVEEEALREQAKAIGADNVVFHDRVSRAQVASLYPNAAALIVSLTRQDLFAYVVPTKTQAYLAAGRPLLMAVNGDAAALVEKAGAGIVVEPENPAAMAAALVRFARMPEVEIAAMGRRGADYYREHLSFREGFARTLAVMQAAARGPRSPTGAAVEAVN